MNYPTQLRPWTWGAGALVSLGGVLFLFGCQSGSLDPAVTTAGSAPPVPSAMLALSTPCQAFATGVCKEAGEQSLTCLNVTATAELMSPAACEAAAKDLPFTKAKLAAQRKVCDELVTKLCAELGKDSPTCKMVQVQTKQYPPHRCTTMMERYPEVIAELRKTDAQSAPLTPEHFASLTVPNAPSFGPADAKVTVVEFSDFQCPYCSKAAETTKQVKARYGKQVRFVFRQFPLDFHKDAALAAQAALAANSQGKFWEYHDKLFGNQNALSRADLEKYAQEAGLDLSAFKKALDSGEYAAAVKSDQRLGAGAHIQGTPAMFVNGERVANPSSFDDVSARIEAALKR